MRDGRTPTGAQGCIGIVSGYLLKVIRESIGLTQTALAEHVGVDVTTVQGWESGRRPLLALRMVDLVQLRRTLTRLGATPAIVDLLHEASEADLILSAGLDPSLAETGDPDRHPLAGSVHRRNLTHMITWPFTGLVPHRLRGLSRSPRRGPVADRPVLDVAARTRFFDHLLTLADRLDDDRAPLLRRQAIYLLGFDGRPDVVDWLSREHHHAMARAATEGGDVRRWVSVRSSSTALAKYGDADALRRFVDEGLSDASRSAANLLYFAYWLGELEVQHDDAFMAGPVGDEWSGHRLAMHLVGVLDDTAHGPLNVHTLSALLLARPGLLRQDPSLRGLARDQVERASDSATDRATRDQLAGIAYAIQLADH